MVLAANHQFNMDQRVEQAQRRPSHRDLIAKLAYERQGCMEVRRSQTASLRTEDPV